MKSVLVVADDRNLLLEFKEKMRKYASALDVITVPSCRSAIDALRAFSIDLIVADLDTLRMGAYELLTTGNHPGVPIVIIAAVEAGEMTDAPPATERLEYFWKPVDYRLLAAKILARLAVRGTAAEGGRSVRTSDVGHD